MKCREISFCGCRTENTSGSSPEPAGLKGRQDRFTGQTCDTSQAAPFPCGLIPHPSAKARVFSPPLAEILPHHWEEEEKNVTWQSQPLSDGLWLHRHQTPLNCSSPASKSLLGKHLRSSKLRITEFYSENLFITTDKGVGWGDGRTEEGPFPGKTKFVGAHPVLSDSLRPHGLQPTRLLPSTGFPRQEYWRGLPFPSPGDLPDPGIEPVSPVLEGGFFTH